MLKATSNLQNEQLKLRPFVAADAAAYFEMVRDPKVAVNAGFTPANSLVEAEYLLSRQSKLSEVYAIVLMSTAEVIGSIGLYERMNSQGEPAPQQMDLGYMLTQMAWGHGYMTSAVHLIVNYAFQDLNLRRLTASCLAPNTASRLILEHAGFRQYDQVTHPAYAQFGAGQTELFFECLPANGDDTNATR
ncbi:GNAT family N-acetyltransferase [Lactiplantibacillus sp. WILCCON 0030]|uniref:GNAT family N-acetyltransferase n=1 Tax=Lactiplantibacillus brownii TaxID=3069269 RepID=A0ABU1A7H7_9LACO|nr:GNAT family N-acetyltransferase [Lactiplantibacillus brownii]MDQ7936823.1 GNAT family N-acetyltransferase [Lactiplantibacillus brownii]